MWIKLMRRIVLISAYPERVNISWQPAYDWSLYIATGGDEAWHYLNLRRDWHLVAEHAVDVGWDENVIIMGDDTTVAHELPVHKGHITSYTGSVRPGHTCQRMFSATAEAWGWLTWAWGPPYRGSNCELWQPDFVYEGVSV